MRRYLVLSLIVLALISFAIYPQKIPTPTIKVSLDKPAGSYYMLGSYFKVYVELDMPAYVRLYAVTLDGKRELLYPKSLPKVKLGQGRRALGAFKTKLTGLVYIQAIAYTDMRFLDTVMKLERQGILKLSKLVFPRGSDVTYLFNVVKKPFGILKIEGNSRIVIDDLIEFKAPKTIFLPVGKHTLLYTFQNKTFKKEVYIQKNTTTVLKTLPPLSPQPSYYKVSVRSTPENALVYIDGKYAGKTPLDVKVKGGFHAIRVEKMGYETYEIVKNVDKDLSINATLVRSKALVKFLSEPSGARVFVNGSEVGTTPLEMELWYGTYNITYVLEGYRSLTFDLCVCGREMTIEKILESIE